jgi:hypothetical protein
MYGDCCYAHTPSSNYGLPLRTKGNTKVTFNMFCWQNTETGSALWGVTKCYFATASDVVFLKLEPANEEAVNCIVNKVLVEAHPPLPGDRIAAFGYAKTTITNHEADKVIVDLKPSTSIGEVTAVYLLKRDRVNLNFPCFETSARFDGGMSGGPIFTDKGSLIGLVCYGDNAGAYSYGCLLWNTLATLIDIDREGAEGGLEYPIFDLIDHGFIAVNNRGILSYESETHELLLTLSKEYRSYPDVHSGV